MEINKTICAFCINHFVQKKEVALPVSNGVRKSTDLEFNICLKGHQDLVTGEWLEDSCYEKNKGNCLEFKPKSVKVEL